MDRQLCIDLIKLLVIPRSCAITNRIKQVTGPEDGGSESRVAGLLCPACQETVEGKGFGGKKTTVQVPAQPLPGSAVRKVTEMLQASVSTCFKVGY